MRDDAVLQLLSEGDTDASMLLVLDEQAGALPPPRPVAAQVLTNRLDVALAARQAGWQAHFNDFDFTDSAVTPCQEVRYRLSKEKRVVEHVLQSAWQLLPVGGVLLFAGYKDEGIKTFAKRCAQAWQCEPQLQRGDGQLHLYSLSKTSATFSALSEVDYAALHEIGTWQGEPLFSKPGVFGWERIDEGSALLLGQLPELMQRQGSAPKALDLGCGFGLLALALCQAGCAQVVATDNNAAAIAATQRTLAPYIAAGRAQVVAADCADGVEGGFDLLLCNPPFHQGFAVEQQLTERFLQAARRLLNPRGRALFVVNGFIPLERKAAPWFKQVRRVATTRSFQVVELALR